MKRIASVILVAFLLASLAPQAVLAATGPSFTEQPGGGAPASAWSQQPQVAIKTGNNVVESATGQITLTIVPGTGTAGAALTCAQAGNTAPLSNGVATFSGCSINLAGSGYRLRATWSQGGTDDSNPFAIAASGGTATKLGFTTQPARGTPGTAFPQQPVVAIQSANGATVTGAPATVVTLSLGGNPGGATLTCSGGLTRTTVNGVATFNGCAINNVGVGYTLVASAPGLTAATSAQFDVVDRLVFTTQPAGAAAGIAFTTQPVVAVRAGPNSTATHDGTTAVTLALGANPGGGILTCTGGLTKVAVAGVAAFTGCSISKPGSGYTLVASASGLTSATSSAFNVTTGANLTVATSHSVITWGGQILISTRIDNLGANRQVQIQGSRTGSTWTPIVTLVTDAAGNASFLYTPVTNLYYRAVFAGASDLAALTSTTTRTVVRQISLLRSINRGSVLGLNAGTNVTFTDTVRPARPELPPAVVRFVFYRRGSDRVWRLYDQRDVVINSLGIAQTTWSFPLAGEWYVRSQARPTPFNANSVWSGLHRFSVH